MLRFRKPEWLNWPISMIGALAFIAWCSFPFNYHALTSGVSHGVRALLVAAEIGYTATLAPWAILEIFTGHGGRFLGESARDMFLGAFTVSLIISAFVVVIAYLGTASSPVPTAKFLGLLLGAIAFLCTLNIRGYLLTPSRVCE